MAIFLFSVITQIELISIIFVTLQVIACCYSTTHWPSLCKIKQDGSLSFIMSPIRPIILNQIPLCCLTEGGGRGGSETRHSIPDASTPLPRMSQTQLGIHYNPQVILLSRTPSPYYSMGSRCLNHRDQRSFLTEFHEASVGPALKCINSGLKLCYSECHHSSHPAMCCMQIHGVYTWCFNQDYREGC